MEDDEFIKFDFEDDYSENEFRSKDLLIDIPIPPWIPHDKIYSNDLLEMLHQEMDDYIDFIKPTNAEHEIRSVTVKRIEKVVAATLE